MHIKIHIFSYNIAIAWTKYYSETSCQVFDDNSLLIGERSIRFISEGHYIIGSKDYLAFAKFDNNGQLELDENNNVTVFLSISSSLRNSNIWP